MSHSVRGLLRKARSLHNRLTPACLVLCYHRVSDYTDDYWRNAVSVKNFADHVTLLAQRYGVLSIEELATAIEKGRPPARRCVVITFDDGYAANLENACGTLAARRVPATFYLNTAWLTSDLFWWDDLVLALKTVSESAGMESPAAWLCRQAGVVTENPTSEQAITILRSAFKEMADGPRRLLMASFRSRYAVASPPHRDHRPMNMDDIQALAANTLFTVAGHTHTHPSLSRLSREGQRVEILENKRILEEIAHRPVSHFSYPFGDVVDFNDDTVDELRAAGFSSAATTGGIPARWPADRFRIPRLSVKNWTVAKFEAELNDAWAL
jgi:peptidoglycan/xylan/chitin deacetylase (PgdA/CDA1 family)